MAARQCSPVLKNDRVLQKRSSVGHDRGDRAGAEPAVKGEGKDVVAALLSSVIGSKAIELRDDGQGSAVS